MTQARGRLTQMFVGDAKEGRTNSFEGLTLRGIRDIVDGEVIEQVLQLPCNSIELVPDQLLPDRFDLTGLHVIRSCRFKIADTFKGCPLLAICGLNAREQTVFLFLDLFEVILFGKKSHPTSLRTNDVRAAFSRITITDFQSEGNAVADFQIRK